MTNPITTKEKMREEIKKLFRDDDYLVSEEDFIDYMIALFDKTLRDLLGEKENERVVGDLVVMKPDLDGSIRDKFRDQILSRWEK